MKKRRKKEEKKKHFIASPVIPLRQESKGMLCICLSSPEAKGSKPTKGGNVNHTAGRWWCSSGVEGSVVTHGEYGECVTAIATLLVAPA